LLNSVTVYGQGVKAVKEGAALIYRKWIEAPPYLKPGELVVVESSRGELLGCALYDDVGPVALRMVWFWACPFRSAEEAISSLLEKAFRLRERVGYVGERRAYRLVHSDGDLLPGLIIDVYDDIAVIQSSSVVWDVHMDEIVKVLVKQLGYRHVYEKSTQRTRRDIGLKPRERILYGSRTRTIIEEEGVRFIVDVRVGQKTGFFLDQRLNRIEVERYAAGETILDLFSYTGGFGIHALVAGARRAVFVDVDGKALSILRENLKLNNISEDLVEIVESNVWDFLRRDKRRYGIVIADPPAFIQDKSHYDRGVRAYTRLFSSVIDKAEDIAFMSSCSAFLTVDEFQRIVSEAAAIVEKVIRPIGTVRAMPPDHPVRFGANYLAYLKALYVEVM